MKIRTKLLCGIVLIILCFISGNVFSLTRIAIMDTTAHILYEKSVPCLLDLEIVNGDVSKVPGQLANLVLETNDQSRTELEKTLNSTLQEIEDKEHAYGERIDSIVEKNQYDKFVLYWNTYKSLIPRIIKDVKSNNLNIAKMEIQSSNQVWTSLNNTLVELMNVNQEQANIAAQGSIVAAKTARYSTIALSAVSALLGIIFALGLSLSISRSLNILKKELTVLAEKGGDLTQQIVIKNKDEIGSLAQATNKFIANLREIMAQVIQSAEHVADSSEQLTISSEQVTFAVNQVAVAITSVAQGSEKQVGQVNETSTVIKEMSVGIQLASSNSESVARLVDETALATDNGRRAVQNTIKQMEVIVESSHETKQAIERLAESSDQIGNIVNIISGLAEQTNLLALNAAIEAARAGEQGRGFAVVAEEVRKLAEQSQGAAKQITTLINENHKDIQNTVSSMEVGANRVRNGIGVVNAANKAFEDIVALVGHVSKQIQEITRGIQQMAEASRGVVTSMELVADISRETATQSENVSANTEEQSAAMQEIAASSQSLAQMAKKLLGVVSKFEV